MRITHTSGSHTSTSSDDPAESGDGRARLRACCVSRSPASSLGNHDHGIPPEPSQLIADDRATGRLGLVPIDLVFTAAFLIGAIQGHDVQVIGVVGQDVADQVRRARRRPLGADRRLTMEDGVTGGQHAGP
jgi:hypothetical protein